MPLAKVVFQEIALIAEFTVAENIFLEQYPVDRAGSIDWKAISRDAKALFDRIGFSVDTTAKTGRLPISQQQMVEIAKALSLDARILIMDEPTAALAVRESWTGVEQVEDEDVVVGSRFATPDGVEAFKSLTEMIPRSGHRAVSLQATA